MKLDSKPGGAARRSARATAAATTTPAAAPESAAPKPAAPKAAGKGRPARLKATPATGATPTPRTSSPRVKAARARKPATAKRPPTATPSPSEVPTMTSGMPASADLVELYLLRHADAGDPMTWAGDDADRPLSEKGRRQAKRLGSLLAETKLRPDLILTSPKLRAADTAKIVGRAVSVKPKMDDRLAVSIELRDLASLLAGTGKARRVVLVGHDPDLSTLASSLTGAAIELKKGAIARIDLGAGGPKAGGGSLRWLVPPSLLTD